MNDNQKKLLIEASHLLAKAADRFLGAATVHTVTDTDSPEPYFDFQVREAADFLEKYPQSPNSTREVLQNLFREGRESAFYDVDAINREKNDSAISLLRQALSALEMKAGEDFQNFVKEALRRRIAEYDMENVKTTSGGLGSAKIVGDMAAALSGAEPPYFRNR